MSDHTLQRLTPFTGLAYIAAIGYIPTLILLAVLVVIERTKGIEIGILTRDPAVVPGVAPYAGVVSNLSAVLWCVAAVVALGAAALRYRARGWDGWTLFLLGGGVLSTALLFDDLFLLHDEILPIYANIPQKGVLLGLVLLACAFVAISWRQIIATPFVPLLLAAAFFAASLAVDVRYGTDDFEITLFGDSLLGKNLIEDGFKLLGIVSWCGYVIGMSWRLTAATVVVQQPVAEPPLEEGRWQSDLRASRTDQVRGRV